MKKRILSLTLVLCMLLPLLPLTAFAATVDGLSYDSPYARDVWFGDVPTTSWYQGLGGNQYGTAYNGTAFGVNTTYAEFMTAFDAMFPFADAIITDREDLVPNYSAEIYDQVPADVKEDMNATTLNGYVTREVLGMARESCHKEYNEVQYMYAYTLDPTQELGYVGPTNLPKIFLVSGTQSDEKSAFFGLYYLIYDLLNNYEDDPVLRYLRHNVKLVVVPCVSPGGINQNTYWNANYVNVNRNYDADFKQVGGYDFVEDENGEWVPQEKTYVDKEGVTLTVTRYVKAEDGNGTHRQVKTWTGLFNAEGDTLGSKWTHTQCSGYEPFDQAEACAIRDLYAKHTDTFLFIDYHTNTSGSLNKGAWKNLNWLSLGAMYDDYCQKLINAAAWHIDRYTENVYLDYNLSEHGVHEGQVMSYATMGTGTTANGGGNTDEWMKRQGVLSMTLESISGFPKTDAYPNGCLGGKYSPATQKLGSELMANWLIAVLAEYGYDGDIPTESYSTSFGPMTGNYPTISGFEMNTKGEFDVSEFPVISGGQNIYQLDSSKYTVTFNGGWEVGYTQINTDASFKTGDNFTPFTQVWQYDGNDKRLFLTDSKEQWKIHGGFRVGNNALSSSQGWSMAYGDGAWRADTTVRYTAEYSGKIVIDITNLLFETSSTKLVVLINGVPVYEIQATDQSSTKILKSSTAEDGTVTYSWGSGNVIPLSGTYETTVNAGDKIDFVSHFDTKKWPEGATKLPSTAVRDGIKDYDFRVSYYEEGYTGPITAHYTGKTGAVTITKPAKSGDVQPFLKWYNGDTEVAGGASVLNATARINPALLGTWIANDATWAQAIEGYKNYLRSVSSVTSESGWIPGSVEVEGNPYAGNKDNGKFYPITAYSFLSRDDAASNIFDVSLVGNKQVHALNPQVQQGYFAISSQYLDKQIDAFCSPAEALNVTAAAKDVRIPYSTIAGSSVPKIGTAVGTGLVSGNNGTLMVGGINLRTDLSTATTENFYGTNLYTHYDFNSSNQGQKAVALGYTVPTGVSGIAKLEINNIFYPYEHGDSNTYKFAIYVNGVNMTGWKDITRGSGDLTALQNAANGLGEFTVKAGDLIELRFRQSNQNTRVSVSPEVTLTIEKKAEDTPLRLVQFANGGAVAKRQLAAVGTSVADLIAAYRETDADFAANGCYINGTWYAAGAELPAIGGYDVVIDDFRIEAEATLEIGATYKMNVYLPAVSGVTEAGVKVNGKTLKGTLEGGKYKVTVAEVYAKDVLDAKVYYTPYYVVNGTEQVSAKSFVLRAADMLDEYVNGDYSAKAKELAQATLDYATVAKAYFAGETADAAILARLASYDSEITGKTPNKLNKTGDEYTFALASLEIGDTINFVFAVAKKDGSALTSFDGSLTVNGKNVSTSEFLPTSVGGKKMMVAVIQGVPESQFDETMTFALKDANGATLATVDYSVQDYCVRTLASAVGTPEADIIRAVYAIGKAASEYSK